MALIILQSLIATLFIFSLFVFLRQILFYGFTPLMPTRPEAIEKILAQLEIKKNFTFYALGFGRSGFLRVVERDFPEVKLFGVENLYSYYFPAKIQAFLKRSRIKVLFSDFYRIDLKKADVIYCYLKPSDLREIYKKLIVDTKDGVWVISIGFAMPYLEPVKIIEIGERKRWFYFLTKRSKEILTRKEREQKRDNKVYFYQL